MENKLLFQDEIILFLKDQFYEDWMNENDWDAFLSELCKYFGVTIQSLSNDLEIGVKNGFSIETQFEVLKYILKHR